MTDDTRLSTFGASDLVETALAYHSRGWRVMPLRDKIPLDKGWAGKTEPQSYADVWAMFDGLGDGFQVGILTGPVEHGGSGLLVIDLDVKNPPINGFESLSLAEAELGGLPVTYNVPTASGGGHMYFKYPDHTDGWRNHGGWRPGVDVRGWHGYVVGYPLPADGSGTSIVRPLPEAWAAELKHRPADLAGNPSFETVDHSSVPPLVLAASSVRVLEYELPAIYERMSSHAGPGKHETFKVCGLALGSWSHLLTPPELACAVGALVAALGKAHSDDGTGSQFNAARSTAGVWSLVKTGRVNMKWPRLPRSVGESGPSSSGPVGGALIASAPVSDLPGSPSAVPLRSWDDVGNGERLIDHAGEEISYAGDAGMWLAYDEPAGIWTDSGAGLLVQRAAVEMLDALPDVEAPLYDDSPRENPLTGKPMVSLRSAFLTHVSASRSANKVRGLMSMASSSPRVACTMSSFDSEPLVVNLSNGLLDLETGRFSAHSPSHRVSMVGGASWHGIEAPRPLWDSFLAQVQPDPEVRAYLARVAGYTLTGLTSEQVIFVHHGTGANGKSVFMDTLARVLGSYAQAIPRSTLQAKSGDGEHPTSIARMRGKRLLSTSETAAGRKLDGELVKDLTGGESVSARKMGGEFFDFRPVGKIHLTTNHLPHLGSGDAIERRLRTVGWDVTIPVEQRDAGLSARLALEASGVLAWVVEGYRSWCEIGLATPEAVAAKSREHMANADPIGGWLETRLTDVPGAECELSLLYQDYAEWAEANGERAMVARSLAEVLRERGYDAYKGQPHRRIVFRNLTIRPRSVSGFSGNATWPTIAYSDNG